jgi:aspartate/methionine/tyrosine aminotransferase
VSADRIVITTGSSAGFLLSFLSVMSAGDRLALADPGYPSYRNILRSIDVEPVALEATLADGYQPTPALLDEARKTGPVKALLAASPANPTGTMLSRAQMQALIDDCAAHGATFISDEIYDRLTYGARPTTALALTDDAIVINSFSKYYCMTGWRIGWMVVPEAMLRTVERLAQNHFICAPHISQIAALAAMDCEEELSGHLETYAANRALLLKALPELGFADFAPADGAFYLYGDVSRLTNDSVDFAGRMLREAGVAAVPGVDFDPARGHTTMRLSFAGSKETVEKAVERLRAWLG